MSSRDAVVRRVVFWAALLAGAALVGSQFGCDRPQSLPSSAGFPHAGRWPLQAEGRPACGAGVEADPINWWIQPGGSDHPGTPAPIQRVRRDGVLLAGSSGPIRNVPRPGETALPVAFVEHSE